MDTTYKYRFSVFTATYNRGKKILNVYDDLLNQTFKDFEWVIVNDGSKDNTDDLIKSIIVEGKLNIQYISKPNGGKHTAWKAATEVFKGQYVVGADDDDRISNDMLEIFDRNWSDLEQLPDYEKFWEVRARCVYEDGRLMGRPLPTPYYDSDYNTINYKEKFFMAEMVGCRKVEVLRDEAAVPNTFLFQEKVSNFPESIRWARAARKYRTRFVPDIVRFYNSTEGSLSNGNKRNCGVNRNMRTTYNTLVGKYYTLLEQRNLMIKYSRKSYFETIAVLAYASHCTKEKISLNGFPSLDRIIYSLAKIVVFPLYLIRK